MEAVGLLVGRENELEFLMSQMASAISEEGRLVLVSGEAGSGKTMLCESFIHLAIKSDCLVLVGRCVPGTHGPYLPFMEAFSHQDPNPFVIAKEAPGVENSRLLLSVLSGVEQISKDRTLILWLEDLHWADSASIALIHFLARNIKTLRVLILGTYRPEDIHAGTSGEVHPLKESLRIMRREGVCHELELKLLELDETKEIVPLRLGGPAEEPLLDLVALESKGNPLFAVEMINYLRDSEQIVSRNGVWRLLSKKKVQTPSTVREVILARTAPLRKQTKQILESASVVGEQFEPHLIGESLGIQRMPLLDELEALEKEYHLIREEEGNYRFSHDKVRQVVYDEISAPRKREFHRSIGLMLERRLPNDELLGQLSWHFDKANENEKCIGYSLSAGKYCYRRKAIREAKSYFLLVLRRTEKEQKHLLDRLEALESLGDLKNDASNLKEWCSYYEVFLALNQDRKARARVLSKAAECWDQVGLADTKKAIELLDEAESISDDSPEVLANVEYRRADIASNSCEVDSALDHIARARRFFEEIGDSNGLLRCGELEVIILRRAYRLKDARELAEKQVPLAMNSSDPERLANFATLAAFACAMVGETELAKTYASEAIELSNKLGLMWSWRLALQIRASAFELEGDLESAKKDASLALENALEFENLFHAAICEIDLGMYESELGNQENAEYHYEAAKRWASTFDSYARELLESDLSILRAELLWRIGAVEQSNEIYEDTMRTNRELEHPYELMNCCLRYGRALARRGMYSEARRYFSEAMDLGSKMGCEKRVQIFASWACVVI